jgi:ornithine--oxo-acid transaminase
MENSSVLLEKKYGANNYKPIPVVLERGEGVWVWDTQGKRYLDMMSAYSAVSQGHRHPRIVAAMIEQAKQLTLTSRAFHTSQLGPYLKELCEFTGYPKALPMNTGAEAVETAIKAARKWGHKVKGIPANTARIITCANNFHGRTTTIVSFSTEPQYQDGFGPFTPGFDTIPYGDAQALERAIKPETCAFLVEPIQGEAGIVLPPEGFLRDAARICKQRNLLLINDEVQTGFGRTGKMFACQHENVMADMMVLGKALGGGLFPVSAVVGTEEVMGVFNPGDHGSTFGGNPLACAIGRAAMAVIKDEKLDERSAEMGTLLMDELRKIDSPVVKEIRGKGLLCGIEIKKEAGLARGYVEKLMERGLLSKETHDQVIRLAPPLVITREILVEACKTIKEVLQG